MMVDRVIVDEDYDLVSFVSDAPFCSATCEQQGAFFFTSATLS
jgi:hypothetical protein